jgi:RNA recognition motif-containing protein
MPRKIRIGAMSITTSEATLYNGFDDYGTIVAHTIDRNALGQSLGVGHVEYSTEQAGTNAIAAKHGTVFDGATIEVTEDR